MSFDKLLNIGAAIVVVAGITTIVIHPTSVQVIRGIGDSFSGAIRAALALPDTSRR
jgi:hypothetical protein